MTIEDIKELCEDVFEDYEIINLQLENDNVIMKIKPKQSNPE